MEFFEAFTRYALQYVFTICVAVGGVFFGKYLSDKKIAAQKKAEK